MNFTSVFCDTLGQSYPKEVIHVHYNGLCLHQQNQFIFIDNTMQRRELPSGFIEAINAHTNPLQPQPPPPIIQRKEAETLMGHCLKQFIRERLYGNLINYTRQQMHNASTPIATTLLPNIKAHHSTKPASILLTADVIRRENATSFSKSNYVTNKVQPTAPTIRYNRTSFSSLEHSILEKTNLKQHRVSLPMSSNSDHLKQSLSRSREKSLKHSVEPYEVSSFLSAVEDIDDKKDHIIVRKQKKLIPLTTSLDVSQKLQKIRGNKKNSLSDRYSVDMKVWDLFCRKQSSQANSLVQEPADRDQPSNLGRSKATVANMAVNQKSKVFNAKSNFAKQVFMNYLTDSTLVAPLLPEQAFHFFELNSKMSDNMTVEDFKGAVQKLASAGPRLWSVLAFRFWDQDQNGVIDSNDIFEVYKKLDTVKCQLQRGEAKPARGLNMVRTLLKELEVLRQKINQMDIQKKVSNNNVGDPAKAQNSAEGTYLEESLLRKKQLRYSDLGLVLGQNLKEDAKNQKHSVIQSVKELGIKFSSCYRYSFMATDHNEQTRQNREYIQRMKEGLKQEKDALANKKQMLIQQALPAISYSLFVGSGYYLPIKAIVLEAFAIIVQNK